MCVKKQDSMIFNGFSTFASNDVLHLVLVLLAAAVALHPERLELRTVCTVRSVLEDTAATHFQSRPSRAVTSGSY